MNDQPHKIRASALAVLPLSAAGWLSFSATLSYDSGENWNTVTGYSLGEEIQNIYDNYANAGGPRPPQLPNQWMKYYSPRGSYHYNDRHSVDAQIAWEVPIYKRIKTMGNISVWNVFNMHYNERYNRSLAGSMGTGYTGLFLGNMFGRDYDDRGQFGMVHMYANQPRSIAATVGLKF